MRVPLLSAATRPLNLFLLVLALAAGVVIALWLLPVGLAVYVALTLLAMRDGELAQQLQARAKVLRVPRGTIFEQQLAAIAQAQRQIAASVAAADGPLRAVLTRVTAQVDSIVEEAHALAIKGQTVVSYLGQTDVAALNAQLVRLDNQLKMATDPMLRQQYGETRAAIVEQLNNAQALSTYRERIIAQLDNIGAQLNNVLAETVRLRAAPAVDMSSSTDSVSARLADVRADMDALGQMLDTALTSVA